MWYGVKTVLEAAAFSLLFSMGLAVELACIGLLILLNLFSYCIEVKSVESDNHQAKILDVRLYLSLVLYIICFLFVFRSGNIYGLEPVVFDWGAGIPLLNNRKFYVILSAALFATSEIEPLSRTFKIKSVSVLTAQSQAIGYAERAAVFALVLLSQYIAVSIVIAARLLTSVLQRRSGAAAELTMVSLAGALLASVIFRLILTGG